MKEKLTRGADVFNEFRSETVEYAIKLNRNYQSNPCIKDKWDFGYEIWL